MRADRVGMRALLGALLRFCTGETAHRKGMRLLRERLSPTQRAQHDKFGYFDAIGSDSGHRFRIHYGDVMNIDEFDRRGAYVCKWCFFPEGKLVRGDIMLAQKLALELFETEAGGGPKKYPNRRPQS
jgi:hypothetical protein